MFGEMSRLQVTLTGHSVPTETPCLWAQGGCLASGLSLAPLPGQSWAVESGSVTWARQAVHPSDRHPSSTAANWPSRESFSGTTNGDEYTHLQSRTRKEPKPGMGGVGGEARAGVFSGRTSLVVFFL